MTPRRPAAERGAIVLVALCFAAVLAISLASYLALSRSAMQLSNRSFQTDLSKHLAETGLEVALDAFNTNDWSAWTLSGTTATRTVTFAEGAAKFGSVGVVGSIKLRVDNYNAFNLDATWVSTATYRPDNVVGRNGLWYRTLSTHSNKAPGTAAHSAYWIGEHTATASNLLWASGQSYAVGRMVTWNAALYRCVSAHTSGSTTEPGSGASWSTYWVRVPYFSIDSDLHYDNESVLYYYGNWYRYYSGWQLISGGAWTTSWRWQSGTTYSLGDIVYQGGFYRYISNTPTSGNALSNTTYWEPVATDATNTASAWPWSSSANYTIGDVVYDGGSWYRCIRAHNNQRPPHATYWSNAPLLARDWDAKWQYGVNDTVFYEGRWHLSRTSGNYGNPPPASSATFNGYWYSADHASMQWSATTAYAANAYRSYGGVWYRCLSANTGQSPNNSTYWTAAWSQSSGVTTGAPVIYSEGIATPPGNATPLRTQVRAVVSPLGLFPNAIGATDSFSLGATTTVNSYDSVADPTAATPGASAVLTAGATSGTAASLSSATVRGFVAAPGSNSSAVSYAGSAQLNDGTGVIASPSPTATNVDLARISRSPFIPQLGIKEVDGGTEITSVSNLVLGTPGAVTPSVYFYDNTFTLNLDTAAENITVVGPVILKVLGNGGLRIRSDAGARIRIAPSGSLRLVINRDLRIESTGGGIINETLDPSKLVILLKRSGTDSFHYSYTGSAFHGVIYLPYSTSTLTIADGVNFHGAVSAQNVQFNGAAQLHYDTQLRYRAIPGVEPAYIIRDWRELFASERASL